MDSHSFMEKLLANPGHCQIVRHISSFLDVKSLAQCRLVCHTWRDLIDNDRPWLVVQLQHIHSQEKTYVDKLTPSNYGNPVSITIEERFPEWCAFIQKQRMAKLKEIVRQMWTNLDVILMSLSPQHWLNKLTAELSRYFIDPLQCL